MSKNNNIQNIKNPKLHKRTNSNSIAGNAQTGKYCLK